MLKLGRSLTGAFLLYKVEVCLCKFSDVLFAGFLSLYRLIILNEQAKEENLRSQCLAQLQGLTRRIEDLPITDNVSHLKGEYS